MVLVVVDSQESALDVVADLRAFRAAEEADQGPAPDGHAVEEARAGAALRQVIREQESEKWADHGRPATASLPPELQRGLPLETLVFPAWDVLPTEADRPESGPLAGRLSALERLRDIRHGAPDAPEALVIAAPVTALLQPCEPPEEGAPALVLEVRATWDPIALGRRLGELGYERTGQVEVHGEFSLRGGILDLFPHTAEQPYRLDFDGETIESIRPFDPLTQRSEEQVPRIRLADSSLERLRRLFSPGATGEPRTLLDHLPEDSAVVWVGTEALRAHAELYAASLVSGQSQLVTYDELRTQAQVRFDTLELLAGETAGLSEEAGGGAAESHPPWDEPAESHPPAPGAGAHESVNCTSLLRLQGDVAARAAEWKKLCAGRSALLVFCETAGDRRHLESLLTEAGVLPAPTLRVVQARLSGGFDLRAAGLAVAADHEIWGRKKHVASAAARHARPPPGSRPIASLFELQIGELVVHQAHGIGRYLGLARLDHGGRTEDYLTILFADDVKLYVPAAHISWVGRYIGGAPPELSRLGSRTWARRKAHVQENLRDIAEELLRVQAARKSLPGICFGPDGEWQEAFEAAFPYELTRDQVTALAGIKQDMEATFPMDRLLCGDVGFGKTELAVRAAFKAVLAGKQVALLAPTTLLAEQHGRTFTERFAGYPVRVAVLSRFRPAREQRVILRDLALGKLDVVIGTHRLLQKDVRFRDLGLAVVDEEQRFGVEHKEFFKQLRKSVDVLTLTATPIPRTLHMALLGLRDISNLQTPPANRRPILTRVARLSVDLLRRAVLRELSRGGQVFVIHPRVCDILEFSSDLATHVPEARIAVGHGQMDSDDLEEVMARFLRGAVDVLVSTTIVESGLDIPTANTMLVHEAQRFGLAELHQLRGRVGRSDIQAYCYLLLPESAVLTPEGLRRLRALEEFDELGAGFQIALKDLEIRGAGNVLGVEQSGTIAEVGYDLYCRLLEATVAQLQGAPPAEEEIETVLRLRGPAFIPPDYVEDEQAVLDLYRRLNAAASEEELETLQTELVERFGPLPEPVGRLVEEARLRRLARAARVPYVGLDPQTGRLVFKLHAWDLKAADRALRGLPEARDTRILDGQTLTFAVPLQAEAHEGRLRQAIRHLLEALALQRRRYGAMHEHKSIQ